MKKTIAFLLTAFLLLTVLTGCVATPTYTPQADTTSEQTQPVSEPISETSSAVSETSSEQASEPSEETDPYEHALALHQSDPEKYRDPGEMQTETQELIQLEDGQWYQSYVASNFNCRFIWLNHHEFMTLSDWGFVPIGSADNAFLYNAGTRYEDASGKASYVERSIAVRGTLTEGENGYAYQLQLPDELIVCVQGKNNTCDLQSTSTLALPQESASLFKKTDTDVTVTGIVMQDKNGKLYLKDVSLFTPGDTPTLTMSVPEEFAKCANRMNETKDGGFLTSDAYRNMANAAYEFFADYTWGDVVSAVRWKADPASFDWHAFPSYSQYYQNDEPYNYNQEWTRFYIEDVRCPNPSAQKGNRAYLKAVYQLNGQLFDIAYEFTYQTVIDEHYEEAFTHWWITAFSVQQRLGTPSPLPHTVEYQDIVFRFFKAYLNQDEQTVKTLTELPASAPLPLSPNPVTEDDLTIAQNYFVTLNRYRFYEESGLGEVKVTIGGYNPSCYDHIDLTLVSRDVTDDDGNLIDRVWKITEFEAADTEQ